MSPSAWVGRRVKVGGAWTTSKSARPDAKDDVRWVVWYRLLGRGPALYGGTFRRKADADARKRWIDGELAAGRRPDPRAALEPPEPRTVLVAFDDWAAAQPKASASQAKRRRNVRLRLAGDELGAVEVGALTWRDVQAWVNRQGTERGELGALSADSVRQYLVPIKQAIDWADLGRPNPVRDRRVRLPEREEDELAGEAPSWAAYQALAVAISPRYLPLLVFLEGTGMRVSEALAAEHGDVDRMGGRIRVRKTKRRSGGLRWIPLTDDVRTLLESVPPEDRTGPIFAGLTDHGMRGAMRLAAKHAGTAHHHPHDLRKRFISLLALAGVPLALGSQIAGHRKKQLTLDVYTFATVVDEPRWRLDALRRVVRVSFGMAPDEGPISEVPAHGREVNGMEDTGLDPVRG